MKILHVCAITGNKASGISKVVPEHVINQAKIEEVAMLNCVNYLPENYSKTYKVFLNSKTRKFDINKLDKPFNSPDLVVFHGIYIPDYIQIYKNLHINNIPYIILPHGSLTKEAQKTKKIKKIFANLILFNKFIKNAKCIQYLSESEKNHSKEYKVKSIVLGNGIYVPQSNLKEYKDLKKVKFVYIGRIEIYQKGLDIIVEAVNLVKDKIRKRNALINIYGPLNKQAKKLRKIIKKYNIEDIIQINDAVYGEQKKGILLNSSIFIQMSRSEGQPLGIMEAMSYGLPCVVTEGTTFKEIVEQNECGYTVESNIDDFANKLITIIEHTEMLKEMSENAYNYALENFDWKNVSYNSINKYKVIIKESN